MSGYGKISSVLNLGLTMAVGMAVCTLLGIYVSRKTGNTLWTLGGMFLGLALGGYEAWKVVRNQDKQNTLP